MVKNKDKTPWLSSFKGKLPKDNERRKLADLEMSFFSS